MKYLVILDDGHGMETAGKRTPKFKDGSFMKENEFNSRVVTLVNSYLLEHNKKFPSNNSFISYLCAEGNTDVPLVTRTNRANEKYDTVRTQYTDVKCIFISVHANALGSTWNENVKGIETYHYPNAQDSKQLATIVHKHLLKGTPLKDRGVKSENFHVLRETKMTAILIEAGFMDNPTEAKLLMSESYRVECAKEIYDGIREYFGVSNSIFVDKVEMVMGTPIIGESTATVKQMQQWARDKKANQLFIDLAPTFYSIANKEGVNPIVVYAQSAKETGYMKFGGVLNASFCNPCGLKVTGGGDCKDPNAHHRFPNWETGILAQVQHLALYAGRQYSNPVDPRHFSSIKGKATSVEQLGGNWAPDKNYGCDIVKLMNGIVSTRVDVSEPNNGNCNHDICTDTSAHNVTYLYDTRLNAHVLIVKHNSLKPVVGCKKLADTSSKTCVGCYDETIVIGEPVIYYENGKVIFNANVKSLNQFDKCDWCVGGKSVSGNLSDESLKLRTILGYSKETNELVIITPKEMCSYKDLKNICNVYKLSFAIEISSGDTVGMKVNNYIKHENDKPIKNYLTFM